MRRLSRGPPEQQRTREEPEPDEQQPGGPWWRAARSTASASHADRAAAANANQTWLGWSPTLSPTLLTADGTASSSHRSAIGSARWNTQITKRARRPRRTAAGALATAGLSTTDPPAGCGPSRSSTVIVRR